MTFTARERLAGEVKAGQPSPFFSALVLQRYGATPVQNELALNLLLGVRGATKKNGSDWPSNLEELDAHCLKRLSGRVHAIEGLPVLAPPPTSATPPTTR